MVRPSTISAFSLFGFALVCAAQPPDPAAMRAVDGLDTHYQAVMNDMALTKPTLYRYRSRSGKWVIIKESARFGLDRLTPVTLVQGGHGTLMPIPGHEATRAAAAKAVRGWDPAVFLFGNRTSPADSDHLRCAGELGPRGLPASVYSGDYPDAAEASILARKSLTGRPHREALSRHGWTWAARPIRFSNSRCLSCHAGSKLGQPAGVMVYALMRDPSVKSRRSG